MATQTPEPSGAENIISLRASAGSQPPTSLDISEVKLVGTPRRIRLGQAARGAGGSANVDVRPDDVVRVEYDNGLVMWVRADDLMNSRGRKVVARGDGSAVWDIDASASYGAYRANLETSGDRGAVALGIKVLEFFGIDVVEGASGLLASRFERQRLGNEPGLYRVTLAKTPKLTPLGKGAASSIKTEQPVLLFLHGTMSSFAGSYAALCSAADDEAGRAATALRMQIEQRYQGEVYCFEHRSLSESPIRNALDLVRQLPRGTRLHLVSHSRGGLVGELLTLGQRDKRDDPLRADLLDQLFKNDRTSSEQLGLDALKPEQLKARDEAYAQDRALLVELIALLDKNDIQVSRFVRVACPARGTTLASGRLDRWLSVLNLIMPDSLFGGVISGAMDFLLAVVKERTDPRTMPGIEAMMPGSALTRLLHLPTLVTSADLSVIAGDIESKGLLGQLKLLAIDWFYDADHDLVVNTGSMSGGIARPAKGARFRLDKGDKVNHFSYFSNKSSIEWLAAGLARAEGDDAGYQSISEAKVEEPRWRSAVRANRALSAPRPTAIVIPGTMGSALKVRDQEVWLAYWALMKGGLGDIGIGAGDVYASDLLGDFYGPLLEHLTRSHRVEILPYDWRLSVREAAKALTAKLESILPEAERTRQAVHLVAHSMGGLVARSMIADGGAGAQAWRRMIAIPGSRLLMLGTPNRGSFEAVRWLTGFNPTQAKLILLDFTRSATGIIDIVRKFPGLAELLPFDQDPNPWARAATWGALKKELGADWSPIEEPVLRQAAATWKLLSEQAVDPEHMIYVAGCQPATVVDHQIVDAPFGRGRKKLQWIACAEGDGTVPWASGRLANVPTFYAPDTGHDQLCSNIGDLRIFRGYVDLLLTGTTNQLLATPPGRGRGVAGVGAADRFVLPEQPVFDDLPDEASLRGMAFGGTRGRRRAADANPQSAKLDVSIKHGDLRYAVHPVLVGHYVDDTIVNAEASLDEQMRGTAPQGPLSRRRDLGIYPGPLGSKAVFFNERLGCKPLGALVVGLGQVGELSPSKLEASVRDLLLDYALRLLQRESLNTTANGDGKGRISASVSSLLVGTGASSLTPLESIEAILRAALAANRKLEDAKLDQLVLIEQIEFIELYQDAAIGAARDLDTLLNSADLGPRLQWRPRVVVEGQGRQKRSRFDANQTWWQRIEITEDRKGDRLRFIATGDRARAEESLASGQLRLADDFIAQACGSAGSDSEVSKTLFEMLLPNRLKEAAPEQRSVVLLLDEASARFPWELLEDRWSHLGRPPAVVGGMIRQLKTSVFRAQVNHASNNTIFVVGNPSLNNWLGFPDLPGARQEAERVRDLFGQNGFAVNASIDDVAPQILSGLHGKPLKVLHLAGHGEHEFPVTETVGETQIQLEDGAIAIRQPQTKKLSGMVIGEATFLTPGDIAQMRYVPELVFVNCCKLGRTGEGRSSHNLLAANLGVEFIRMGVRAVVCAGWSVDDAAALTFAMKFYDRMLNGETFGAAVLAARRAALQDHPGVNTWGAYQCYGDQGYRLVRDGATVSREIKPPFYSPAELVVELCNRAESTRMQSKEKGLDEKALQEKLRSRIDELLARVPKAEAEQPPAADWLARADVCAAVGFAYGEANLFNEAVEWLDKALAAREGDCPVRAAEQCANYRVRLAQAEWTALRQRSGGSSSSSSNDDDPQTQLSRTAIAGRIELALYELDAINSRGPQDERLSLMGGACKRLAWVQNSRGRTEALLNMAGYYRQAFDMHPPNEAYAFCNWAVGCLLLEKRSKTYAAGNWHAELAALCDKQMLLARKARDKEPSFWGESGLADLLLVQLLLHADNKARVLELAHLAGEQYAAAFARGSSLRETASVQENIDFLIELTKPSAENEEKWPDAVCEALEAIRRTL